MIDELLAEIAERGWLINNLYQIDGGLWRANLRQPVPNGDWFTTLTEGPTAYDALMESFHSCAEFTHTPETHATIDRTEAPSLLAKLGLTRKPTPFTDRRV